MTIPEITNDEVREYMGQLVSEMDHLVDGVVEDIGKARMKGLSLERAMAYLEFHYWDEKRVPRLFVLEVIRRMVENLDREEDDGT